ncbi:Non-specific serine/threonine protein kinase [Bertholletia excelsa]
MAAKQELLFPPWVPSNLFSQPRDLSFNMLEGPIPDLRANTKLEVMYLTGNLFTGPIPKWMTEKRDKLAIDLSYNNFSEVSEPAVCIPALNLYRSFSNRNYFEHAEILKEHNCPKDNLYSLHINCGGEKVKIGKTTYLSDEDPGGVANFCPKQATWGTSTTGYFEDTPINNYIVNNVSILKMNNSQLYTEARLSPLSLTYYGRCLANGNYTVKLYFAEIILRSNQSFQSLGRRSFDVYIQDKIVFPDVDIENKAGDVDQEAVLISNNTLVKNNTIEIRFEWTGNGTTAVPKRGTHGPLVSAISIESNSKPPSVLRKKIITVVGAVALAICIICAIVYIIWRRRYLRRKPTREQELRGFDLHTGLFTLGQIKAATNDFDIANKLGEGGFGSVFKGTLLDGTFIAVKQLSSKSKQGSREFVNEIGIISGLQHPNLVRLYGCCIEQNQLLLVYEYMENNSLAQALFGPEESQLTLDWPARLRICVGVARGLAFLHEESTLKIVHRDIKATNILLDRDLNPKISDFGLAKLDEEANSHITTRVAGTIGYMAPEYALWGYLTHKADVYSFGVVVLEVVAGKNNMKYRPSENYVCLLDWALVLQQKRRLMDLVDPRLGSNFPTQRQLN